MSPSPPRTLGWLIATLKWYEELRTKQATCNDAVLARSAEAESRQETYRDRMRVSGEIAEAPGRGRLQLLCDELDNDAGLSAKNVVKLRATLCREESITPDQADSLILDEVADALEGTKGRSSRDQGRARPKKRRGRRTATNPEADRRLCHDWQAAKLQGMSRAAFARERGITVQELIDAQHREKYRRTRDAE
jgi:hypothetical protein